MLVLWKIQSVVGIAKRARLRTLHAATLMISVLLCSPAASAYSVLTHEEIVDLLWIDEIRPLLLARFPGLSEEQLGEAHAYAYGGSVVHDLGYYPFGSHTFSDLVHYVRSGDFVRELIAQSQDANEYAFALGALSHYASDIAGHPFVNEAVAIEFPKLRAKYGDSVRYAQGKSAHLRAEFGFDTVQVAKHRYAPEQYHDFIGFKVSKPLLERVFPVVYGVELKDVLAREDLAIGTFRFSVSQVIPELTQVAARSHKDTQAQIRETPDREQRVFLYRLSRAAYEKEWGREYQRAGFGTRMFAVLLRIIPRIGPFKKLEPKYPNTQTEELYIQSVNETVDRYRALLKQVRNAPPELPNFDLANYDLANYDLDSGEPTRAAEYSLADDAYAALLARLSKRDYQQVSPELRQNILRFYSDLSLPFNTKKKPERWQEVLTALERLKSASAAGPIEARTPPQ